LDGTSLPEELVCRALELGYSALALTDHDSVSGAMEFAMIARSMGLNSISGAEISVRVPDHPDRISHLTLLVKDAEGWNNLCRLLTLAHSHTRQRPDRKAAQPSVALTDVLEHAGGLVCLSGCASHGLQNYRTLCRLRDVFGCERLRVELQRPYVQGDRARNRLLARLAERLGVRLVATGNVHAHTPMRALLQDAFVAIANGMTLDGSEVQRRPNHTHVLSRPEAMAERFSEYPEAVAESVRLAAELEFELTQDLGYRYPGSDCQDAPRRLGEICRAVFAERYPNGSAHHDLAARRKSSR
jgi:error-prone DNA polymerase